MKKMKVYIRCRKGEETEEVEYRGAGQEEVTKNNNQQTDNELF